MAEDERVQVSVPGLTINLSKRWTKSVPCGIFCVVTGGLQSNFHAIQEAAMKYDESMELEFERANMMRLVGLLAGVVICAALLMRFPERLRWYAITGYALCTAYVILALGVQAASFEVIAIGSMLIGVSTGFLLNAGVRLLQAWMPETQWQPPIVVAVSYILGVIFGHVLLPAACELLNIVVGLHAVGLSLLVVGMSISEDCRLPSDAELAEIRTGAPLRSGYAPPKEGYFHLHDEEDEEVGYNPPLWQADWPEDYPDQVPGAQTRVRPRTARPSTAPHENVAAGSSRAAPHPAPSGYAEAQYGHYQQQDVGPEAQGRRYWAPGDNARPPLPQQHHERDQ